MDKYEKIRGIKHFDPKYHKRMPLNIRAAQFSPFSALNGYDDVINDAGKFKNKFSELSLDTIDELNSQILRIIDNIDKHPLVYFEYFDDNDMKYISIVGNVRKIDEVNRQIILDNKIVLKFDGISKISLK